MLQPSLAQLALLPSLEYEEGELGLTFISDAILIDMSRQIARPPKAFHIRFFTVVCVSEY